jgi:aquaporin Z
MRRYITEFIGTFFLVFTVCCAVATGQPLAPLAIGAVLAVMVFAGGHISGGHYNPAVSLAAFVRGRLNLPDLGYYWAAQIVGGLVAAGVARFVVPDRLNSGSITGSHHIWAAFVAELLFTFALAYVVLNVATSKDTANNSFYGLAIGFTVLAGAYAVGGISGAAFNPAIAIGAMVTGLLEWSNIWIYLIAEILGAAMAAYLFLFVLPGEKAAGDIEAASTE